MRWKFGVALLVAAVVCLWPRGDGGAPVFAQGYAPGGSPGLLTRGHADLDDLAHCNDCHDGSPAISSAKCLGCHAHEQLASRIAGGEGFHASAMVRGKPCETCHHDHKGRPYDPMGWASIKGGERAFDHALAGWPLGGRHVAVECQDCHTSRDRQGLRVFTRADRRCEACHAKEQPHRIVRALACDRCHNQTSWRPARTDAFDHGETAMRLTGAHRNVACTQCHPNNVYGLGAPKPDACDNAGCHRNVHTGHLFGARDCTWCHSPELPSMKQIRFAHEQRFAIGRHGKLSCVDCHTKARGEQSADMQCDRCHAASSHHGTRFQAFGTPPRCGACHPATSWLPSAFNHDASTKFRLGGHSTLSCRACHRGSRPNDFEDLHGDTACKDCHAHRTVHADAAHPNGKYTTEQCLLCHMVRSLPPPRPEPLLKETHGIQGAFPLTGGHKAVACASCHVTRLPSGKPSFTGLSPTCGPVCHEDVLHQGSLGAQCEQCHVSGTWAALRFDHDQPLPAGARHKVASFPLRGLHRNATCESCHPARDYAAANTTCSADGCHGPDDAHQGHLGNACERCHTETGDNRFDHAMSRFPLDGKHRDVPCGDCHPSPTFKPRPRDCAGCHPVPAFHRNGRSDLAWYDSNCGGCHTTRGW
jgi:hypothetical protein